MSRPITVATWRDHQGGYTAAALDGSKACATDISATAAVKQIREHLEWSHRNSTPPPLMRIGEPRLVFYPVPVRTEFETDRGVFATETAIKIRTAVVFGKAEDQSYACFLPLLGVRFHCYSESAIKNLAIDYARRALDGMTTAELARMLIPPSITLDRVHVRVRERKASPWEEFYPALRSVAEPIGVRARRKQFGRAWGRDREVRQLAQRLAKEKTNLLLVGPSGVGKTTLLFDAVRDAGRSQASDDNDGQPTANAQRRFWLTNASQLIAGMQYLGQWEERCEEVIEELSQLDGVLCIENLLELIRVGGATAGSSVGAFFAPYLEHGELRMICEATPEELDACRRLLPGFDSLFQIVQVKPFDATEARGVLEHLISVQARSKRLTVEAGLAEHVFRLFRRFLPYQAFPGQAAAFTRQLLDQRPAANDGKNATDSTTTLAAPVDQDAALPDATLPDAAVPDATSPTDRAQEPIGPDSPAPDSPAPDSPAPDSPAPTDTIATAGRQQVGLELCVARFVKLTGIPERMVRDDRPLSHQQVLEELQQRIYGQPEACQAAAGLISTFKAGLNDPKRPLGVYIFCGPTGVGKTELAKVVAEVMFGAGDAQRRLLRLDMSEYAGYGAAERLISQPDGQPSQLVKQIRQRPFVVLLLDEIEKAASEVFDVLLSVLDEGRLTDRFGRTTTFCSSVIIMTSNLGAETVKSVGFTGQPTRTYQSELMSFFRPEFFNRLDATVTFQPLQEQAIRIIARRHLEQLARREGLERAELRLTWSRELEQQMAREGVDPRYGARPLQRTVERRVTTPLARWLVDNADLRGGVLNLDIDSQQQLQIQYRPR